MNKYFATGIFPVICGIIAISSCGSSTASETSTEKKTLPVIELSVQDTVLPLEFVADIQARKNVEVHARTQGVLSKIWVDEGQWVKKGQILFQISNPELESQLKQYKANYNSMNAEAKIAEVNLSRVERLHQKKVIAASEVELAQAQLQAFEAKKAAIMAEIQAIEQRLGYTSIRAPFDGIIDRIPLKSGSIVKEGDLLTTLSDLQEVYAYFNLPENKYYELLENKSLNNIEKVQLILAGGSEYPYDGIIEAAESEFDKNTGSIAFRARFNNKDRLLKHGATGKLIIYQKQKNVMLVPQKAVMEVQDKNYVYVLDQNNTVKRQAISPAFRIADYYILEQNLAPKTQIISEGMRQLKDGDIIVPQTPAL